MSGRYQGDPAVKITPDGAKMLFIDGQPMMDAGIENAVQISYFTKFGWWGNTLFRDPNQKIGSNYEKQRVIIETETIDEIQKDARAALEWMITTKLASEIEIEVINTDLNHVQIFIKIYPPGQDINELLFFFNGINWINQALSPSSEKMKNVI